MIPNSTPSLPVPASLAANVKKLSLSFTLVVIILSPFTVYASPNELVQLLFPVETGLELELLSPYVKNSPLVSLNGRNFLLVGFFASSKVAHRFGKSLQKRTRLPFEIAVTTEPATGSITRDNLKIPEPTTLKPNKTLTSPSPSKRDIFQKPSSSSSSSVKLLDISVRPKALTTPSQSTAPSNLTREYVHGSSLSSTKSSLPGLRGFPLRRISMLTRGVADFQELRISSPSYDQYGSNFSRIDYPYHQNVADPDLSLRQSSSIGQDVYFDLSAESSDHVYGSQLSPLADGSNVSSPVGAYLSSSSDLVSSERNSDVRNSPPSKIFSALSVHDNGAKLISSHSLIYLYAKPPSQPGNVRHQTLGELQHDVVLIDGEIFSRQGVFTRSRVGQYLLLAGISRLRALGYAFKLLPS